MAGTKSLLVLGSLVIALAVSVRFVSFYLENALPESVYLLPGDEIDVLTVLGYTLHRDGSLSPQLQARVATAKEIWEKGIVDWVVFSGGHPGGGIRGTSEAMAMASWAHDSRSNPSGPPPGRWLLEDQSTSTRENAVLSLKMLQDQGVQLEILAIATNPFHQLRSYLTFQCAAEQLNTTIQEVTLAYVKPSMGPVGMIDQMWLQLVEPIRELAALLYYYYMGYLCTWK